MTMDATSQRLSSNSTHSTNPVAQILDSFILCPKVPGKRHLKCLHFGVGKETSLTTHGLLHTGNIIKTIILLSAWCHEAVLQPRRSSRCWNTHGFSFQIVAHFLHVCIRMSVYRMPMDIIAEARVGEQQHWNLNKKGNDHLIETYRHDVMNIKKILSAYITDGAKVNKLMDAIFHKALIKSEVNHL